MIDTEKDDAWVDDDYVWKTCLNCDEEYHLPETLEKCPICGQNKLETIL